MAMPMLAMVAKAVLAIAMAIPAMAMMAFTMLVLTAGCLVRYVDRRGDEGTSNGLVHHAQSISCVQLLRIIKIQNTSCNAGLLYVHKLVAESIIVWTLKTVVHRHIVCDVSKFMWQLSHMCIIMGCICSSVVYGVSSCGRSTLVYRHV